LSAQGTARRTPAGGAATCAVSDLPDLPPSRARIVAAKPFSGRHRGARIVKPIALGWLLTIVIAAPALSQADGRNPIDGLRTSLDAGSGGARDAGPDLTPPTAPADPQQAASDPQASESDAQQPAPRLPSLAEPASPLGGPTALPGTPSNPGVPPRKPTSGEDPFDALGLRLGAFLLRPAIEVFSGYDSNPARVPGGHGSALLIVAPELVLQSDWTRHELTAAIRGSYNDYPATALADRPTLNATIDGRIDVTRDSRIDLEGRSVVGTDYPGSPNLGADIAKLPVFTTVGGTLGLGQRFGSLDVALKGMIDRTTWQDSQLTDGSTSSNADRNFNQVGGELRAGYALNGELKPFVALDFDTRTHDLAVDRSGLMRDSDGTAARAGVGFTLAQRLTGDLALGYLSRVYRDPTLADVRGPSVDGSLLFILTPLTSVKFTAKSIVDESVLAGVSGVLQRDTDLSVDHALRRWLIATVRIGYGRDDYVGSTREDRRYLASLAMTYKLTRAVQVKGELQEVWLCSSEPNQNYAASVALIGLRYQP
jgi:hypothetical protein